MISYNPGVAALGVGATGFRTPAVAENRAGKAGAPRDEAGPPAPYTVEIPLRFR